MQSLYEFKTNLNFMVIVVFLLYFERLNVKKRKVCSTWLGRMLKGHSTQNESGV